MRRFGLARFGFGGRAAAAVEQAVVTALFVALFPTSHTAAGDAENLGGLAPQQLSADRFENHLLDFHGPLHGWHRIALHRTSFG
jgi:hypothetical protein